MSVVIRVDGSRGWEGLSAESGESFAVTRQIFDGLMQQERQERLNVKLSCLSEHVRR